MQNKNTPKLLFIYNANSGTRNAIMDSLRKIFSPNTYDCNLCDITFGVVLENKEWKRFRARSKHEMVFLHKDEFASKYKSKFGHKFTYPIVLAENGNGLDVFITTQELNQLKSADGLIRLVAERV